MLINTTSISDLDDLKRRGARVSYSQFGEDMLLAHHMRHENGFYVDIGCHDPHRFSNTAIFYLYRKWSGLNIDADPNSIEKFKRARPRDININCGVSDKQGEMNFTIFQDAAQNSFDPIMVANASKNLTIDQTITIPVRPLKDILDEFLPKGQKIDYMNIDCEGLDEKVVDGNDFRLYTPKFISIEIHGLDLEKVKENPVFLRLTEAGYRLKSHCLVTSIFERIR